MQVLANTRYRCEGRGVGVAVPPLFAVGICRAKVRGDLFGRIGRYRRAKDLDQLVDYRARDTKKTVAASERRK
jgi:hypothetical protein